MLSAFISSLRTVDLRRKILFTLGVVILYRVGATIPSPGVNYKNVHQCIEQVSGGAGAQIYSLINLFSGGALLQLTVFAVGVMPYITASIIVQLLTVVALAYGALLEGAVLIETVFSWPGIGRYLTTALFAGDTTAVMGGTLLIGVCFVLINNLTDLLVRATDPRVR